MIKNIIFDLGNVLISFKPYEYFIKNKYPEVLINTILTDIFNSKEWRMLDNGEISIKEAINAIDRKSSLNKDEIAHIFDLRTNLLFPLDMNVRLLPGLKKRGFRLYYLSNFPIDIFDEVRSGYFFFRFFDGGLISAEVKTSKPDLAIYRLLMEKYSLKANESLFIDDNENNVMAAETLGIKGIFTDGSPSVSEDLEKALNDSLRE